MKKALLYMVNTFWQPLVRRYIARPTRYSYKGIRLVVQPGVFHPRFFFSTRLLLLHLQTLILKDKRFLELGAGSGLIALYAAQQGAKVTALDISPIAVNNIKHNQQLNLVFFPVLLSDLFTALPPQQFDVIVINPPYYKKDPTTAAEHAWYCGQQGQYFIKLFSTLKPFIHAQSQVLMILSDACDIDLVKSIAGDHHFVLQLIKAHQLLIEKNFIFNIAPLA